MSSKYIKGCLPEVGLSYHLTIIPIQNSRLSFEEKRKIKKHTEDLCTHTAVALLQNNLDRTTPAFHKSSSDCTFSGAVK